MDTIRHSYHLGCHRIHVNEVFAQGIAEHHNADHGDECDEGECLDRESAFPAKVEHSSETMRCDVLKGARWLENLINDNYGESLLLSIHLELADALRVEVEKDIMVIRELGHSTRVFQAGTAGHDELVASMHIVQMGLVCVVNLTREDVP